MVLTLMNKACALAQTSKLSAQTIIMDNNDLMEIIKHLTSDNRDLKKRIDILEEILSNWLPIIEKEKE